MRRYLAAAAAVATLVPLAVGLGSTPAGAAKHGPLYNRVSGVVALNPNLARSTAGVSSNAVPAPALGGIACPDHSGSNDRVNQECTNQTTASLRGRGTSQNETSAAVSPTDPKNVIASQNDYRRGDANCGVDWSTDGGKRWGSTTAPMTFTTPGFTHARHYWHAGGDTSVGFDSSGEAYLMCQVFGRGATADEENGAFGPSAFLLFRSADGGASWSFQGSTVTRAADDGSDGQDIGLLDKEYMAVDANGSSPFADRIYVSWTQYNLDFTEAPVYFAYSSDYGATWHQTGEISGADATLCPVHFDRPADEGHAQGSATGTETACNATSYSEPFVAPNGDVYVVFADYNNCAGAIGGDCTGDPNDNHNQFLIVKSTDGGNTFGPPVKVADYNDLPDCVTYTGDDAFRACVPTAPLSARSVFRAANYPSGAALTNSRIVVDFGSYINPHSNSSLGNCAPAGFSGTTGLDLYTGVGDVNGCNNDILRSVSTNGGASFTGTTTQPEDLPAVSNEARGGPLADQWWQWTAKSPVTGKAVDAYYDRQYGGDQSSGNMDITVTRSNGSHVRATDHSMPPSNEFPGAGGFSTFLGDYNAVAVGSDGMIHPVWADTRNPIYVFDPSSGDARQLFLGGHGADIYTASIADSSP
jgi:hypothetical protein